MLVAFVLIVIYCAASQSGTIPSNAILQSQCKVCALEQWRWYRTLVVELGNSPYSSDRDMARTKFYFITTSSLQLYVRTIPVPTLYLNLEIVVAGMNPRQFFQSFPGALWCDHYIASEPHPWARKSHPTLFPCPRPIKCRHYVPEDASVPNRKWFGV